MKKLIALNIMLLVLFTACSSTTESDTTDSNMSETNDVSNDNTKDDTTNTNNDTETENSVAEDNESSSTFTLDELSQYNGQDGNPAYIAIDGVVYDVTDNPMWKNGQHQGQFQAGADLTEAMKGAPHGLSKLSGLEEVGTLVE